jgi:hypothetical protein
MAGNVGDSHSSDRSIEASLIAENVLGTIAFQSPKHVPTCRAVCTHE